MIRPIEPADAAAAAALIRAAFSAIPEPLDPAPSALRETEASVLAHLAHGGGAVMEQAGVEQAGVEQAGVEQAGVEQAGVEQAGIVACVLWSEQDGGLYLGRLAVAPHCRNRGLAAQLVLAAEAEARRLGLPRLHLGVRLALPGNRRLFARLGFVETTLHAHDGYGHPTWVAAEKWLATAPLLVTKRR